MKKIGGFLIVFLFPLFLFPQNVSLNHSGTQFDGFENPVQQSFQKDLSRKYAFTLLPHLSGFINFKGNEETAFKKFLFSRTFSQTNTANLGQQQTNQLNGAANIYLANYRIFLTRDYNRELGFSLQLRNEGNADLTDETFVILDNYKKFTKSDYENPFNSNAYNQAYWQLGATYRENYNNKWAFGAKASLLNGLVYNKIDVSSSHFSANPDNSYTAKLTGSYLSSFGFGKLDLTRLIPNLKNLGFALSLASSYQTKSGYYFSVNLKDMGFIHWSKNTPNYNFDSEITVTNPNAPNSSSALFDQLRNDVNSSEIKKSFISKIDTKVEFAASKEFGFYKPVFVYSKSIFNPQGQFALINNFRRSAFVFSINPIYDLLTKLNLGSQIMVKSPNMEFYMGTEQIFPTYYLSKSYLTKNDNIGKSNPRASFYVGINVKFGSKVQNIANADDIPGLNDKEVGYVVRLSPKEKKELQKRIAAKEKAGRKNTKKNNKR